MIYQFSNALQNKMYIWLIQCEMRNAFTKRATVGFHKYKFHSCSAWGVFFFFYDNFKWRPWMLPIYSTCCLYLWKMVFNSELLHYPWMDTFVIHTHFYIHLTYIKWRNCNCLPFLHFITFVFPPVYLNDTAVWSNFAVFQVLKLHG